jgi:L-serine deaminase
LSEVVEYEQTQKGTTEEGIRSGLLAAWKVMKDAVNTGLTEDMTSRSGMINNGAKKVYRYPTPVLSKEFQNLIARALAAKEVNSCMGRIVAAPTAGASGIMPGVLYTLQEIHHIDDNKIIEAMLMLPVSPLSWNKRPLFQGRWADVRLKPVPPLPWDQAQLSIALKEIPTRFSMRWP